MRALFAVGAISVVVLGACDNQTSGVVTPVEDTVVPADLVQPDTVETEPPVVCAEDQCKIDERCYDNGEVAPDNPCGVCVVLSSTVGWTLNDAAACDDEDPCTIDDSCNSGKCTGTPRDCDDDDPCTRDRCDGETGACLHEPAPTDCGEDPCEVSGSAASCEDGNPCTADHCEPWVGCVHTPITAKCDDGDACTADDLCVDGQCVGTAARSCDDENICTIDVCKGEGGCSHTSIASLCTDENPCTDEACDPAQGCVFPFNTAPCDDGNACTTIDTCTQGACLGRAVDPDDGNPCTDDLCDRVLGVMHVPNQHACDDGDACTVGDVCSNGACQPGATPLGCDDDNLCTNDSCDPATGCVNANNTVVCDDESACTAFDRCFNGACTGVTVDCDDGNVCTTDSCDPEVGCRNELIQINDCRPTITVSYPPRGATIQGSSSAQRVTVAGTVQSGAGAITSLKINGINTSVEPSTGAFSRVVTPHVGGNALVIEATDDLGTERRVVQSFLWSTAYHKPTTPKNGIVSQGVGVWLDKNAIDDNNRSLPPNDLGTILQLALQGFDIAGVIPNPAAEDVDAGSLVGEYDIFVRNLSYTPPTATLSTRNGGLRLHVVIRNGHADIQAKKTCSGSVFGGCWGPSSISGDLTFDSIVIDANINLSVSNHGLVATIPSSSVQANGVDVSIDGAFGFIADFILGFFIDDFVDNIEDSFNDSIGSLLGPLISDALSALAFSTSLDIPQIDDSGPAISVDLLTDFQGVDFDSEGGRIYLRAGGYASQKGTPYENKGVPDRVRCNSGGSQVIALPEQRDLELVVAYDTLNSLLYAAWRGGLLEFDVPADWLDSSNLPDGVSNLSVSVSGLLAPTASDCGGNGLEAMIGDLRVHLGLNLGPQYIEADVWVTAAIGIELGTSDGEISLTLDGINTMETEVEVTDEGLIGAEAGLRTLIETQVIGGLVGELSGTELGSIPLPDIDLSGAIPGLPPGTGIKINPQVLYRANGNLIVGGKLN